MSARVEIVAWITAMSIALGLTYGGMAAQLAEMFPARIRYSSMSIPYHVGTGYFGGFLPLIASYMVARSGNPYQGLWYTAAVVAAASHVVSGVVFDPLGTFIATCAFDGAISLWETPGYAPLATVKDAHKGRVTAMAGGEAALLTCGSDHSWRLWRIPPAA